jgi:hypothetical protein
VLLEQPAEGVGRVILIDATCDRAVHIVQSIEQAVDLVPLIELFRQPRVVCGELGHLGAPVDPDVGDALAPEAPQGVAEFPLGPGEIGGAVGLGLVIRREPGPDAGPEDDHREVAVLGLRQAAGDGVLGGPACLHGDRLPRLVPGDDLDGEAPTKAPLPAHLLDGLPGELALVANVSRGGEEDAEGDQPQ